MQQHPIPQNVTSYQFRLIGDMTIKQFVLLAVGIGMAVFFYFTNLFSIIKWTFVLLSAISGAALAFLPVEERPLDEWVLIYIKAIYRPTKYLWKKDPHLPDFLKFTRHNQPLPEDAQAVQELAIQRKQQGIQSFLQTLPEQQALSQLESSEQTHLDTISQLFSSDSSNPSAVIPTTQAAGQLKADTTHTQVTTSPSTPPQAPIPSVKSPQKAVSTQTIPLNQPVSIAPKKEQTLYQATPPKEASITRGVTPTTPQPSPSISLPQTDRTQASQEATTDASLPFPKKPEEENVIVGMVLDQNNKIIPNTIIEIRDTQGIPVRATKTNQLGQFFSTTPLKNGIYEIEAENAGHSFDILKLELTGQIVKPLKIQAK